MRDATESRPDLLAIGETMVALHEDGDDPVHGVSARRVSVGGAESNVASVVSQLGLSAAWAGALGRDDLGETVLRRLREHGIDTSLVVRDDDHPTGYFVRVRSATTRRVRYHRRGSAASRLGPEPPPAWRTARPRFVHVSGVTAALSESCRELMGSILHDRGLGSATVSFDVNHRAALWPTPAGGELLELAQSADVVFVGRDEAAEIWGTTDADSIRRHLDRPSWVIVKDAEHEAVEFGPHGRMAVRPAPVDIVDSVGAGDAFAGGWLAARLRDESAHVRLRLAHWTASRVLTEADDVVALPRYREARSAALASSGRVLG